MKELTDELINKYIDNELTVSEINQLKEYLSAHPSEVEKLKAHKLVDSVLSELEFDSAPDNITDKIMSKIKTVYSVKPHKSYFIRIIFSFFGLGFVGIYLFGLTQVSKESMSGNQEIIVKIFDHLNDVIPSVNFSLSSDIFMLVISTFVLITFIATYLMINSHKMFKDNIENLSH